MDRFLIAALLAVAGGSFAGGLYELDGLLTLAAPFVVLVFLTLAAAALCAGLVAALGGMRRTVKTALAMLVAAYVLLFVAAWYRFFTDPDMFQDTEPEESVRL
jgi:Na+-driven multidrug efflux pump